MVKRSSQGPERVAVNREEPGKESFVRAVAFIVRIAPGRRHSRLPRLGTARAKDLGSFALNQGTDRIDHVHVSRCEPQEANPSASIFSHSRRTRERPNAQISN